MADLEEVGEALGSLLSQRLKSEAPVLDAGTLEVVVGKVIKESRFELADMHENLMHTTETALASLRADPVDTAPILSVLKDISNRVSAPNYSRELKLLTAVLGQLVTAQQTASAEMFERLESIESALLASKKVKYDKQGRVVGVDMVKAK